MELSCHRRGPAQQALVAIYAQIMVKVGHLRPAVMAMVLLSDTVQTPTSFLIYF
jgi:hypothetical protein